MKTICFFLTAFLLILFGCDLEDGFYPQGKAKFLFVSGRIENSPGWNLFSMNGDGSDQQKITELSVRCARPVVSHSGKTVLFVHNTNDFYTELYSINVNGTNLTLIDRSDRQCGSADWSFDDKKIIYSRNRNESTDDTDLILFDVATGAKKSLTSAGNNSSAKFSSDNQIAFCHQSDDGSYDIYKMDGEGANSRKIIAKACCPVWSPDGKKIAYQSPAANFSSQIFVANSDGTNRNQLTSTYSSRIWPGWAPDGNLDPQWTPDGKKIVYVSWEDEDPEIYIMNSDGTKKVKLTSNDKRDEDPEITSNGKFILFTSRRNMEMQSEIFIMDIDGKNQRALSNYKGSDIYPLEIN